MNLICLDGQFFPANQPVLLAQNRGYRYGDGFFETIRMVNGIMPLLDLHLQRFFDTAAALNFDASDIYPDKLKDQIQELALKNECAHSARIRLTASRGDGLLYDSGDQLHYLIQCVPTEKPFPQLSLKGIKLGTFPQARKSCDQFAKLKSANFLPYVMAARYAIRRGWDDAVVLNTQEQIADTTLANIFIVQGEQLFTPPLSEGPVAGVMRQYLINALAKTGIAVHEKAMTEKDLLNSDEIFLTNALFGIKWVEQYGKKQYTREKTTALYNSFISPVWS